jgi:hypothetical protein
MVPAALIAQPRRDKRTDARFTQSTREENPPRPKKIFLTESGRKSSGRIVGFKPLEEDGFQTAAGTSRTADFCTGTWCTKGSIMRSAFG